MAIFNSYVSLPEGNVANPLIYLEFGMVCTPIFGNLGMGWDVFFFLRTTLVGSKTSEKNTGRGTIQKKQYISISISFLYIYIYIYRDNHTTIQQSNG